MPTLLIIGPYRFHFYANENDETPHVHVEAGRNKAKHWLTPVRLAKFRGFRSHELTEVEKLVTAHRQQFLEAWLHSSFNDQDVLAATVQPKEDGMSISLVDGRSFYVPYSGIKTLSAATKQQRENFRLIADGDGIHWPELDEDLSIAGLFRDFGSSKQQAISEIPQLIADLYRTTQRLGDLFSGRPFTPDGHLVGSIGEVVAEYIYDLELESCSTPQIDAHTRYTNQTVQIKLTGKQGKSYGFRWTNSVELNAPDLLICLKLTELGFEEVYAGPFPVDLLAGRADSSNGQLSIGVAKLSERNPKSIPQAYSLAHFNELFRLEVRRAA